MGNSKQKHQATASLLYLHILFQTLKRHGINKHDFLELCECDTSPITNRKARLPVSDILYYWSKAIEITQCPTLGLDAGLHIHPSDYGIMSHVWMNCETLREAAQLTIQYKHLMNNAFQAKITQTKKGYTTYSVDFPGVSLQLSSILIEMNFASILHMGQFLTERTKKDQVKLEEVHFKHTPNAASSIYEEALGCSVKFEQDSNNIVFQDQTLDLPIHSPNRDLRDTMVKMVDKLVTIELGAIRLADRVCAYIEQNLSQGIPEAETAAKHFGFSLSTFKRHLQGERTNYLELSNKVRKDITLKMIVQADISLGEIAFLLGFANVSAFHRAFKRWFQQTPNQYRKQHLS